MTLRTGLILVVLLQNLLLGQYQSLTNELIFKEGVVHSASLGTWTWIPGKDAYLFFHYDSARQAGSLQRYELVSGDTTEFVPAENLVWEGKNLRPSNIWFDRDGSHLLLQTQLVHVWRRSRKATYYLYDIQNRALIPLSDRPHRLRNVKFSPDGEKVAYLREDNNLYVFNIPRRREIRLTRDGSEDILNGHFGWVYEEEFGSYDAYRWSPDSRHIAFWREDQSAVKAYPLTDSRSLYPTLTRVRYPKVGEANPVMRIGVVRVTGGRTVWIDLGSDEEYYYPRLHWVEQPQEKGDYRRLLIYRLNRRQNHLELLQVNRVNGRSEVIFEETDPAWVDMRDDFRFLEDGTFLWTSERSGYRHIYRLNLEGKILRQITFGAWEVTAVVGIDIQAGKLYFTAKKESFLENHGYRIDLDGSDLTRITPEAGWHSLSLSPTRAYFIDHFSTLATPTRINLRKGNGELQRLLKRGSIKEDVAPGLSEPAFLEVTTADGVQLDAVMILPPDFVASRQYPVLMYGYGMLGAPVVANRWGGRRYLWHQSMAQRGYIIFSVDSRQAGRGGKAAKNLGYGDIGKWLIHDHIQAVKYLSSLPYVDSERIGIWGKSGGGYLAALAMTKGAAYFRTGVAVAPVTDFRLYDTIYTERYMGLLKDNQDGYDSTSVLTHVKNLKGNLLVIHGTGDDNVHDQNSLQLIDRCIKENVPIDVMFYPNRNHGLYGGNTSLHWYNKISAYFLDHL